MNHATQYAVFRNTGRRSRGRPIVEVFFSLTYAPSDSSLPPVCVPHGFETDFASVPRAFWRIASPWDAMEPSVIHDYLCRNQIGTRADADRMFLRAMEDYGVKRWRRRLMYRAVRMFGWTCYGRALPENGNRMKSDVNHCQ